MSRRSWPLVLGIVVALLAPASAGAWHYTFHDFFDAHGSAISSGRATAKKCGPGGKLGTYDYRSFAQALGDDFELSYEVVSKMSVRQHWRRMNDVEVNFTNSPEIPDEIAAEGAGALAEFHQTVFTRFKDGKHPKLEFRYGSFVFFGEEIVEPGESSTKFDPKAGC